MKRYKCKVLFKLQLSCNNLTYNALQYPLFCIAKEPVLLGKSAYIAAQNNRFCNAKQLCSLFACTSFTKKEVFCCCIYALFFILNLTCIKKSSSILNFAK